MSAKEALGYFLPKVDEDARKAKKEGRLVCWSASVAPPEFCTAMDIAIVYPETHAAGIGARHGAPAMLEVAENKGYNQDICSYCRVNMGYMELLKQQAMTGETPEVLKNSPASPIPLPDVVLTCNNICNTLLKWYENLAKELNVPLINIDVPLTMNSLLQNMQNSILLANSNMLSPSWKNFVVVPLIMINSLKYRNRHSVLSLPGTRLQRTSNTNRRRSMALISSTTWALPLQLVL